MSTAQTIHAAAILKEASRRRPISFRRRRSSLPDQLSASVPSCAQSCISTYVSQEFGMCASDDFSCLCSQYSSEGFTLGELTYGCLSIACDQQTVNADKFVAYDVCDANSEAVTPTHTQSLFLPSTTATSVLVSVTSAQMSSPSSDMTSTTTASSLRTTSSDSATQISTSTISRGVSGIASSTTVAASSTASTDSSSSGLNKAQAVGVSVAVFGTVLLIIAIAFLVAVMRRRKSTSKLDKNSKRTSYDFIDVTPALDTASSSSRPVQQNTVHGSFNSPGISYAKTGNMHARDHSTIHPVPLSMSSERGRLEHDPFTDNALAEPPKLAIHPAHSPASEHNSMLLPEKPPCIGPPPPPKKSYLAPRKLEPIQTAEDDKAQASVANFSRPALPAQPTGVFLPLNPKTKMAPPPALARREQLQQQIGETSRQQHAPPYQVPPLRSAQHSSQYALHVTASPESTRKVSLSLDIPRQANKSVGASPPMQVFPAASAHGTAALRIVNRTPSPHISEPQREAQQEIPQSIQTQRLAPPFSSAAVQAPRTPPPPSRPQSGRSGTSSSLVELQDPATTDNVLSYYTSPKASREAPPATSISATPIDEGAQRRKAVPMAITITKPTYPPRAVRSNPRNSGGSDTSFESNDSDEATPPEQQASGVKSSSPGQVQLLPQQQRSPIATIHYPKIPRSSNQIVPRSPGGSERVRGNGQLSPTYASPLKSGGLAGVIEQSNLSPPRQVNGATTPEQQAIDTSTLSGSTLAVKGRGDGAGKELRIDTLRAQSDAEGGSRGRSGSEGRNKGDEVPGARNRAPCESPLKGYGRVTSTGRSRGGGRPTPHSAGHERPLRSGGQPAGTGGKPFSPSEDAPPRQRKIPPALMIGNGFRPVDEKAAAAHEVVLQSPLLQYWEPKLTPQRRGDDLFLEVSLASPV
nr:hypothetical protein CFP56_53750 [Quercus suber]